MWVTKDEGDPSVKYGLTRGTAIQKIKASDNQ